MVKLAACLAGYTMLFAAFEYINACQMTSGSWRSICLFAIRPWVLLFFALSPIVVWGINKELYELCGQRFWYAGAIAATAEVVAYAIGAFAFYRHLPSARECVALALVMAGVLVGFKQ